MGRGNDVLDELAFELGSAEVAAKANSRRKQVERRCCGRRAHSASGHTRRRYRRAGRWRPPATASVSTISPLSKTTLRKFLLSAAVPNTAS